MQFFSVLNTVTECLVHLLMEIILIEAIIDLNLCYAFDLLVYSLLFTAVRESSEYVGSNSLVLLHLRAFFSSIKVVTRMWGYNHIWEK